MDASHTNLLQERRDTKRDRSRPCPGTGSTRGQPARRASRWRQRCAAGPACVVWRGPPAPTAGATTAARCSKCGDAQHHRERDGLLRAVESAACRAGRSCQQPERDGHIGALEASERMARPSSACGVQCGLKMCVWLESATGALRSRPRASTVKRSLPHIGTGELSYFNGIENWRLLAGEPCMYHGKVDRREFKLSARKRKGERKWERERSGQGRSGGKNEKNGQIPSLWPRAELPTRASRHCARPMCPSAPLG